MLQAYYLVDYDLIIQVDGSNNIVTCTGGGTGNTLQASYDNGNTITTSTGRDISSDQVWN